MLRRLTSSPRLLHGRLPLRERLFYAAVIGISVSMALALVFAFLRSTDAEADLARSGLMLITAYLLLLVAMGIDVIWSHYEHQAREADEAAKVSAKRLSRLLQTVGVTAPAGTIPPGQPGHYLTLSHTCLDTPSPGSWPSCPRCAALREEIHGTPGGAA